LNQRGSAESVNVMIPRATAMLLIASWTHLLQEISRFCVTMAAVTNRRKRILMLSILVLIKRKSSLDTNQRNILELTAAVRFRRKQEIQTKLSLPIFNPELLP
jgi:hypothetical protein